jgi:hypothetical protein
MLWRGIPEVNDTLYHVVLIPYDVTHKPELPRKSHKDYLIVINQSSFVYQLDLTRKEVEFRVVNQSLSAEDLKLVAKEMLPSNARTKYYLF